MPLSMHRRVGGMGSVQVLADYLVGTGSVEQHSASGDKGATRHFKTHY